MIKTIFVKFLSLGLFLMLTPAYASGNSVIYDHFNDKNHTIPKEINLYYTTNIVCSYGDIDCQNLSGSSLKRITPSYVYDDGIYTYIKWDNNNYVYNNHSIYTSFNGKSSSIKLKFNDDIGISYVEGVYPNLSLSIGSRSFINISNLPLIL